MMKMLAGLMSQNNIHASQGHRAALCKACGKSVCRNKGGGTGVPQPFLFVGIEKERFGYGS